MRNLIKLALTITFTLLASSANADTSIYTVPQNWRLQQYIGGALVVYYTGSSCADGLLYIPGNTSADEKNRFWSSVMTAKATSRNIGVFYETSSGSCNIVSFYLQN